jgi:NADPH:quinone reductase-like Zn-dependent oxidoreductase
VMAIQIAKAFGAYVAATASTRNQDLLRELGADLAIDYTREKISKVRPKFDLVLDGVGESVWAESFRVLKVGGRLVTLTVPIPERRTGKLRFFATATRGMVVGVARGLLGGKRLAMTRAKPRGGELEKISALIEAGKIRPVVERTFPLDEIAEAHRLSEQGHVRGKLVIRIHED